MVCACSTIIYNVIVVGNRLLLWRKTAISRKNHLVTKVATSRAVQVIGQRLHCAPATAASFPFSAAPDTFFSPFFFFVIIIITDVLLLLLLLLYFGLLYGRHVIHSLMERNDTHYTPHRRSRSIVSVGSSLDDIFLLYQVDVSITNRLQFSGPVGFCC